MVAAQLVRFQSWQAVLKYGAPALLAAADMAAGDIAEAVRAEARRLEALFPEQSLEAVVKAGGRARTQEDSP